MGKTKQIVPPEKPKAAPVETKKKAAPKKGPKAKKAKPAENGSAKAEVCFFKTESFLHDCYEKFMLVN
ncbi:hypothetical protein INR49_001496 [Caranx melampygus]|nr:hypothetical protein INR49_001496 [Caranx melampygus]